MPATMVYRDEGENPDGSRYEMVEWPVPVSEYFPQGLQYSFQYMGADGDTFLRYGNSPYHLDVARHHRHTSEGEITELAFTGLSDLIERFQNEVNEIHERRSD